MAIDFLEKEVERLKIRFNLVYENRTVFDIRARQAAIMTICRVLMLVETIKNESDEERTGEMTREFCRIREVLNGIFDLMEFQKERRGNEHTGSQQITAAGG
jgi:hypothetical protein